MKSFLFSFVVIGLMSTPALAKDAAKAVADKAAAIAPTKLKVDPAASEVRWEASKKVVSTVHHGTVNIQSGEIVLAGEQITGGTITLDMKSISNKDLESSPKDKAKLEGHLKSPDFFDVEKYPTATFTIKSAKPVKDSKDGLTHDVTGDLAMKGKTQPVTIPVTITRNGDSAEAKGKAVVDRTKYDVRYGSGKFFDNLGDKVINDDIKLDLKVVAKK
jgi:polyisoprenoid-binding protein YceI